MQGRGRKIRSSKSSLEIQLVQDQPELYEERQTETEKQKNRDRQTHKQTDTRCRHRHTDIAGESKRY